MPKSGTVLAGFSRLGAMRCMIAVCWLVVQSSGMTSPTEKLLAGARPRASLQVGCIMVQVLVANGAPLQVGLGSARQVAPASQGSLPAGSGFGSGRWVAAL